MEEFYLEDLARLAYEKIFSNGKTFDSVAFKEEYKQSRGDYNEQFCDLLKSQRFDTSEKGFEDRKLVLARKNDPYTKEKVLAMKRPSKVESLLHKTVSDKKKEITFLEFVLEKNEELLRQLPYMVFSFPALAVIEKNKELSVFLALFLAEIFKDGIPVEIEISIINYEVEGDGSLIEAFAKHCQKEWSNRARRLMERLCPSAYNKIFGPSPINYCSME